MEDNIIMSQQEESDKENEGLGGVWVHQHFEIILEGRKKKRRCLAENCDAVYSTSTSHLHLKKHWVSHGENLEQKMTKFTFHNDLRVDAFIKFVICENQEYSMVDSSRFRTFLRTICPSIKVINRHTVSDIINMKVKDLESEVKTKLSKSKSIALTMDLWSARKYRSFGAITAHYIDDEMAPKSLILEFESISYPHNATTLQNFLSATIKRFEIEMKVLAITTDNASSNLSALEALKVELSLERNFGFNSCHFRCIAHVINLAVNEALKPLKEDISPFREAVKIITSSPKRAQAFEALQASLIDSKDGEFKPKRPLRLIEAIDTRWNSTFLLLERVKILKRAIIEIPYMVPEVPFIDPEKWILLDSLVDFLRPFNQFTKDISGEKYSNISLIYSSLPILLDHLVKFSDDPKMFDAASAFARKLQAYSNALENDVTTIATILDPRVKMRFLKTRAVAINLVRRSLERLKPADLDNSNSSQAPTSASSSIFDQIFINDESDELEAYLAAPCEKKSVDVLGYWQSTGSCFPQLQKLAQTVLCIQATSVASERVFSAAGSIDTAKRNQLSSESFRSNMLLRSWLDFLEL